MKKLLLFLCAVIASFTASAVDYTSWYVNVPGDYNGWDSNGVQANAEGIATHSNLAIGTTSFKIKIWNGSSDVWLSTGGAIEIGTPTVINGNNDSNMTIAGATAGEKFNVTFDCSTNTLTVTRPSGEEPPVEVDYTTWYVNVPGVFNDWADNGVQPDAEGIAVQESLDLGDEPFKIKIWNGSSTVWLSTGGQIDLDTPTVLSGNVDPGMTVAGASAGDKFKVTFDCATNTITINKIGGGEPIDYTSWYVTVVGGFNNWGGNGVQPDADGVVTQTGIAIGDTEFKIKVWNGNDIYYSNGGEVAVDTPTVLGREGNNMKIAGAQAGESFDITFDCSTKTLTITKAEAPDYTSWYVNVVGGFNDWTDNGVAANAEGVAVHESLPIGTSEFKIKVWNGDNNYYSTGGAIEVDTPTVINGNEDANMTIAGAAEGDSYMVTFDCATNTITVTKVGEVPPVPEIPETLYLIGNINGCADGTNPAKGVEMTREGDNYTCQSVILDANDGYGWFSFCTKLADADAEGEEAWNQVNSYDRFGPETETVISGSESESFVVYKAGVNASACESYKIQASTKDHSYQFIMNFTDNTLTVTTVSGINTVDAEAAGTPVFFNLQGQRVDNPANGIFVRVLNGKAEKIMK